MIKKLDKHITKSLKTYYKKRMIFPVIYIIAVFLLLLMLPERTLLAPAKYETGKLGNMKSKYLDASLKDLYFTGYTRRVMGNIDGYYYYTIEDRKCLLVLLKPSTSEMGLSHIKKLHIKTKVINNSDLTDTLFVNLSRDLSWSESGVREAFYPYILSEPDANGITAVLLSVFIWLSVIASLIVIALCILYIIFPWLSAPIRRLIIYGNPRAILDNAEEELATLPQLATDDMFITQHYFIETSDYGVAVVPISKIRWIYKYSTLHRFLGKHLKISYTLYITTDHNINFRCPKNAKTDIDGIIDYLSEANHNILVGFSEKNREAVEGDSSEFVKKLRSFLMQKI